MSRQGENVFKDKVRKDLKESFGKKIKILATQERGRVGVLDLICCLYGDSVTIELKIDGEEPTKLQQKNIDEYTEAGGQSFYSTPSRWPIHLAVLKDRYKGRA